MRKSKIKKIILNQEEPFSVYDILCTLIENGEDDKVKILNVLNDLIKANLVYYDQVLNINQGECGYAFFTNKYKEIQVKKNIVDILNLDNIEDKDIIDKLIELHRKGYINFNKKIYENKKLILKHY